MKKNNQLFWNSAISNERAYMQYFNRLMELGISMFEWKNLPDSIDPRFLELTLFCDGYAIFFYDEVMGYLALQCMIGGRLNVYRIPIKRRAYAANGYQQDLDSTNSVIIYNNLLHTNSSLDVEEFSKDLHQVTQLIRINGNAQRTPFLIACDESERLSMENLYAKYEGNQPCVFGDKSLRTDSIKVLNTGAPYLCDKLYTLKREIWNEALTFLGIQNVNIQKRERLITDEVIRNSGGVIASRYSRLESRRLACAEINKMFGLDIWCDYREDYQVIDDEDVLSDEDAEVSNNE